MSLSIEKIPKIDIVRKAISKLNETEFPTFEATQAVEDFVNDISKRVATEFGIIPNFVTPFTHKDFSLRFFRAREVDRISNIDLIREHSYPPINCVGMGRCNFPNFPVFYCSDNPITALLEVVRNSEGSNRRFCISKWELDDSEKELIFQNFLQTSLPDENPFNFFKDNLSNKINEPFIESFNVGLEDERKEGLLEYLKYLDTSFINDDNYSLSASLAYRALYANHNLRTDILMYPSQQTNLKGVNLALSPNFADDNLKLVRLYIVELNNYNSSTDRASLTFHKYAKVEKNIIVWKSIKLDDEYYNEIIKTDFGDMIISD